METWFADVIVPLPVPNRYTYRIPRDLNDQIVPGARVLVQFGKSKLYTGIVAAVHNRAPVNYEAKYVEVVLDEQPIVTPLQLKFWDWLAWYYCAFPGDVMNAALPSGLKLSSTSHVVLNQSFAFDEVDAGYFTEAEHKLLDALHAQQSVAMDEVPKVAGVRGGQALVNRLMKKKAVYVYEDVKEKYAPKLMPYVRLSETYQEEVVLSETLAKLEKKAFRQAEALLAFLSAIRVGDAESKEWAAVPLLAKQTDHAAIQALVKKGILELQEFEVGRLRFQSGHAVAKPLNEEQVKALQTIEAGFAAGKPVLLHGVTGSGKTEVYIQLIAKAIAENKQVLYLLPEIALTTQLITRLRAVFGEQVGVYHSRFSEQERVEIWRNLMGQVAGGAPDLTTNQYRIIVGARSALMLPFDALGLVIVDEEHDASFKQQDPAPRYHARDAAIYLAHQHKAAIVLGTATPSVESYYNAKEGKYALATLTAQHAKGGGTDLVICDTNYFSRTNQMRAMLTPPLYEAIGETLKKKGQVILFQNRRGFAPVTECRQCGYVPHCTNCDVALIYHKQRGKLLCHYCGYTTQPLNSCTACGSNQLHFKGAGTEKVEEEIEILFPAARIGRMDLDTTRSKHAHKQLLDEFESGAIDILIGTQMVTKGLHFDHVDVVGILNADGVLHFPDFRSFERAYQLIMQVRGRAGRTRKGRVFIQTASPAHPVIKHVADGTQAQFYEETLRDRLNFHFPPFYRLVELTVVSNDVNEVNHLSDQLLGIVKHWFSELLGPEFPVVSKIRNAYHKRILIKVPKTMSPVGVREHLHAADTQLRDLHRNWKYRLIINVDPV